MSDFDSMVDDSAKAQAPAMPIAAAQHQNFDSMVDDNTKTNTSAPDFDSLVDDNAKYQSPGQTIAAGAEAAGRGLLGPVAPYLERVAGVHASDIRERAEAHPIIAGVGETAGLVGGLLTGTGEAALMTKAGEIATHAAGLGELAANAPYIARVGSAAVRQAAEMAVLQGSDEVAKRVMQDPESSAQHALGHIGLAAALGAAGGSLLEGAVNPLWKATVGPKVEGAFKALTSRLGGVEGAINTTADELEQSAGVVIPHEIKSVINDAPGMKEAHSILSQSDTTLAGRRYQKNLNNLNDELGNKVAESLGKTPQEIERAPDLDKYNRGSSIAESIHDDLKKEVTEIGDRYDALENQFKAAPLSKADLQSINEQIAQKSMEKGWDKAESDTISKFASNVMEKMGKQETVADIKKFITNLNDAHPFGSSTYQAAKDIKGILREAQNRVMATKILEAGGTVEEAAARLKNFNQLNTDYRSLMDKLDGLNEHLHVGRYEGPQSFLTALKELGTTKGERVLERTSGKNNANILEVLKDFPSTLEKVKQFHIDTIIDKASTKTAEGTRLNVNNLIKNIEGLSPQLKELIASPEQHTAIDSVGQILESLKDPHHNWSNTGRTAEKLGHGSISPLSLLAIVLGHAEAGLLSFFGKLGFNEGKDALRLFTMKFLSSSQPIKSEGIKAAVNYMEAAYKSESLMNKAVKSVFKPGAQVLAESAIPKAAEIAKLEKLVAKRNDSDSRMLNADNTSLGHYMPDHQAEGAKAIINAKSYLQSIEPKPVKLGVLDKEIPPSSAAVARYHRALEIAQQPAIVLQHCKDGTLQSTDMADLNAMYPAVYKSLSSKLTEEMVTHKAEDEPIPYKTRMCLSLFLAQPLDSTMSPNSIMAAQPKPQQQPSQPPQEKGQKKAQALEKGTSSYKTPTQAAEGRKASPR